MSEEIEQEAAPAEATLTPDSTTTEQDDWRSSLSEDLQKNPNLEKYSSVESLAKAYINASSMLGRDKLDIPKSDEEWGDFYNKIGRPESPDGYEFEATEMPAEMPIDDAMMKEFKEMAHTAGLTGQQANELQKWYFGQIGGQFESMVTNAENEMTQSQNELRKEWGNAYDEKLGQAMRAVREFGGQELVDSLEEAGVGNDTNLIKAFSNIGNRIMGDTVLEGSSEGTRTPSDLKAEIAKIQSNPGFYDAENLERPAMVQKMQGLMEELHGRDVISEHNIGRY